MRLVSNHKPFTLQVDDLELVIAPNDKPPFNVSAVVEEQDVALIIGESTGIPRVSDKPAWYLSQKLEKQKLYRPGDVVLRHADPVRLLAMVHDFDQDPSWNSEWVAHALSNIVHLIEDNRIASIKLPVLGADYGHMDMDAFLPLFFLAFLNKPSTCLTRMWLCVDADQCEPVFSSLKARIG